MAFGNNEDFPHGALERGDGGLSLGLDEFLNYGQGENDSGDNVVLNWKKNIDDNRGSVLGWLHTKAAIQLVNRHQWHKVVELKDDNGNKRSEVFGDRFVCHENPELIKLRKYRFSSRQDRNYPVPQICPFDKMLDMVFELVRSGRLPWTEPLFAFQGSGSGRKTEDVILHAAGIYGGFGEKNMARERVQALKRARINAGEAWRQDARPKANYLLQIVEHDHPEKGTRLVIEGDGFKNAMSEAINKERTRRRNKELMPIGPAATPFPFMFEYDKTQKFDSRYSAAAMGDELSPAVRALIFDETKIIDTREYRQKSDPEAFYASLQEHCLIRGLDWGSCFADGIARVAVPAGAPVGEGEAPHLFSCEHCGKATMQAADYTCDPDAGGCGSTYVDVIDPEKNEPVGVRIAKRPCTKCRTLIDLPEAPANVGDVGATVACPNCGTKHHEHRVTRADRPCESTECDARIPLTAGATCPKCGKAHEFGESDPVDAPAEIVAWVAEVEAVAAAPAAKKPTGRGAAARGAAAAKA